MADVVEMTADRVLSRAQAYRGERPVWTDATELVLEPDPDREWVVEGLLERQGRILLAGAEGCGKSLLAMTLATQVAAGLPPLDAFPASDPRRVVYLDLEMARSSTRRRLRTMAHQAKSQGFPIPQGALLLCLRPDGLDLNSAKERRDLQQQIERFEPELVIIDPLYKLTITDSTYERDTKPTLLFLDRLRLEMGVGLVVLHHLRKRSHGEASRGKDSSDIFGSSVLLRWPETTFIMSEDSLRVHKDRDETFSDKRSWPVKHGPTWPIGLGSAALLATEEVFEYLRAFGPVSGNDVAKNVGGRRQGVWDALRLLEQEGRVRKVRGRWEVAE